MRKTPNIDFCFHMHGTSMRTYMYMQTHAHTHECMNTCIHLKSVIDPSFLPQENRVECDKSTPNTEEGERRKTEERGNQTGWRVS